MFFLTHIFLFVTSAQFTCNGCYNMIVPGFYTNYVICPYSYIAQANDVQFKTTWDLGINIEITSNDSSDILYNITGISSISFDNINFGTSLFHRHNQSQNQQMMKVQLTFL
jgi:hypothetical protein